MTDKAMLLVDKLMNATLNSSIEWKETEVDGVFQSSFPSYAIRASVRPSRLDDDIVEYFLSIYDDEGRLVEEYGDEMFDRSLALWKKFKQIYDCARRQALGVEKALDSILGDLDDLDRNPFG